MYDYEEACPVSMAASVLCERWTLQIIREMLLGATRFSELQTYLPRMSPSLLNTRLRTLEKQGIILRKRVPEKKSFEYLLTPTGLGLKPVVKEIGKWGMFWVFDKMDPEQFNLSTIIRDFAVALQHDQLPAGDLTIQFNVSGEPNMAKRFIMVRNKQTQVCDDNMGYEVDVYLNASLETLGRIWYGELDVLAAQDKGLLTVAGQSFYVKTVSKWLGTSQFAEFNPRNSNIKR